LLKEEKKEHSYGYDKLISREEVLYWHLDNKDTIMDIFKKADHIIIASDSAYLTLERTHTLFNLFKQKKWKSKAIILSAIHYVREPNLYIKKMKRDKLFCYAMPDLPCLDQVEHVPYYPLVDFEKIDSLREEKNDLSVRDQPCVIAHAPGSKKIMERNRKGTFQIIEHVDKLKRNYNIQFNLLHDMKWEDNIRLKSRSHIFIDEIIRGNKEAQNTFFVRRRKRKKNIIYLYPDKSNMYYGSVGKSGLEAMALGCFTVATSLTHKTEPYFPPAPAYFTRLKSLKKVLKKCLNHRERIALKAQKQEEWARKYLHPEFVVNNVTRHIR